jgi:hypothetical protein
MRIEPPVDSPSAEDDVDNDGHRNRRAVAGHGARVPCNSVTVACRLLADRSFLPVTGRAAAERAGSGTTAES